MMMMMMVTMTTYFGGGCNNIFSPCTVLDKVVDGDILRCFVVLEIKLNEGKFGSDFELWWINKNDCFLPVC